MPSIPTNTMRIATCGRFGNIRPNPSKWQTHIKADTMPGNSVRRRFYLPTEVCLLAEVSRLR